MTTDIPLSIKNFIIFNNQLVELEIMENNLQYFSQCKITFQNLKHLKIKSFNYSISFEIVHYIGFPYTIYELFREYSFDHCYRTNKFYDNEQRFNFLQFAKDDIQKTYFPNLRLLSLLLPDQNDVAYLFITANVGLPLLQEIRVENENFRIDDQVLNKVLSKRPSNFRFILNNSD